MKRFILAVVTSMTLGATPVIAMQNGHGAAPKPQHVVKTTPTPTTHAKTPTPKAHPSTSQTAHAVKPVTPAHLTKASKTTQTVKTSQTVKPAKSVKSTTPVKITTPVKTTKPVKATTPVKTTKPLTDVKKAKTTTATSAKTTKSAKAEKRPTVAPTDPFTVVVLTPTQQKLQKNTNLAGKLRSRLPAGTDLMTAADGFRNLGQFVAAVNVSNNLGIPFIDLKTKMVTENKSLGQSIQALKSVSSPTIEAQRAEYDALGMIADSEREPVVTATAVQKTKTKPRKTTGTSQN